jgi:hypothetical protein
MTSLLGFRTGRVGARLECLHMMLDKLTACLQIFPQSLEIKKGRQGISENVQLHSLLLIPLIANEGIL